MVHSQTLPAMSRQPAGLAPPGYAPTGVVPATPLSRVLASAASHARPHGKARPSLPRAARSHSASDGRRKTWGLGTGDWGLGSAFPIPNPQSPVAVVSHSQN